MPYQREQFQFAKIDRTPNLDIEVPHTTDQHGVTTWLLVHPSEISRDAPAAAHLKHLSPQGLANVRAQEIENREIIDRLMAKYGFDTDGTRLRPFPNQQED